MTKFKYHVDGTKPTDPDHIFVFGSNESGIHGAGAAREAYYIHGAGWNVGFGLYGRSFAIPTKDFDIISLPLDTIKHYVDRFVAFTHISENVFFVTGIGTGLAGFKAEQIAPMFKGCYPNCNFPEEWKQYLE